MEAAMPEVPGHAIMPAAGGAVASVEIMRLA